MPLRVVLLLVVYVGLVSAARCQHTVLDCCVSTVEYIDQGGVAQPHDVCVPLMADAHCAPECACTGDCDVDAHCACATTGAPTESATRSQTPSSSASPSLSPSAAVSPSAVATATAVPASGHGSSPPQNSLALAHFASTAGLVVGLWVSLSVFALIYFRKRMLRISATAPTV